MLGNLGDDFPFCTAEKLALSFYVFGTAFGSTLANDLFYAIDIVMGTNIISKEEVFAYVIMTCTSIFIIAFVTKYLCSIRQGFPFLLFDGTLSGALGNETIIYIFTLGSTFGMFLAYFSRTPSTHDILPSFIVAVGSLRSFLSAVAYFVREHTAVQQMYVYQERSRQYEELHVVSRFAQVLEYESAALDCAALAFKRV